MKNSQFFSITLSSTYFSILTSFAVRLNPTLLPLLIAFKLLLTSLLLYKIIEDKRIKGVFFAVGVGSWFGLFIGYWDLFRVYYRYFSTELIYSLIGVVVLVIILTFVFVKGGLFGGTKERQLDTTSQVNSQD